jgi:hypothetical protein
VEPKGARVPARQARLPALACGKDGDGCDLRRMITLHADCSAALFSR